MIQILEEWIQFQQGSCLSQINKQTIKQIKKP
jgi:hypothetical protein